MRHGVGLLKVADVGRSGTCIKRWGDRASISKFASAPK